MTSLLTAEGPIGQSLSAPEAGQLGVECDFAMGGRQKPTDSQEEAQEAPRAREALFPTFSFCAAELASQEATEEASEEPSVKPKFQAKLVCGILSHIALHGGYSSWISGWMLGA